MPRFNFLQTFLKYFFDRRDVKQPSIKEIFDIFMKSVRAASVSKGKKPQVFYRQEEGWVEFSGCFDSEDKPGKGYRVVPLDEDLIEPEGFFESPKDLFGRVI